jgi:hypothetical protein
MTENDYMKSEEYKTISETLWSLGFDDGGIWLVHQIIVRELKWRHDGD